MGKQGTMSSARTVNTYFPEMSITHRVLTSMAFYQLTSFLYSTFERQGLSDGLKTITLDPFTNEIIIQDIQY